MCWIIYLFIITIIIIIIIIMLGIKTWKCESGLLEKPETVLQWCL